MTHVSYDVKNPLTIFFGPHIDTKGILETVKPRFPNRMNETIYAHLSNYNIVSYFTVDNMFTVRIPLTIVLLDVRISPTESEKLKSLCRTISTSLTLSKCPRIMSRLTFINGGSNLLFLEFYHS